MKISENIRVISKLWKLNYYRKHKNEYQKDRKNKLKIEVKKEMLTSSLYVSKNRKYMYHIKHLLFLNKIH